VIRRLNAPVGSVEAGSVQAIVFRNPRRAQKLWRHLTARNNIEAADPIDRKTLRRALMISCPLALTVR
jgi:hypothetical protein